MSRKTFFTALALLAFILACSFGAARASAQVCCNYKVNITPLVSPLCLPVQVTAHWDNGSSQTTTHGTNGISSQPITSCPPPPTLQWVSLDGGATQVPAGSTTRVTVGTCCYVLGSGTDINGCWIIVVSPC